ncbi:MAG: hypothetical protein L7W40_11935, partial [Akkermansiaceae bacterium]|nr:hypothetical protein [Akkermansiaceae bacterium]
LVGGGNSQPQWMTAGKTTSASWGTNGTGRVEAIKPQALRRHGVQCRGVDRAGIVGWVTPAHVIGHHQNDVGALVREGAPYQKCGDKRDYFWVHGFTHIPVYGLTQNEVDEPIE